MAKEIVENQRKALNSLLGEIMSVFSKIDNIMKKFKHRGGRVGRSLKPKSPDLVHIDHRKDPLSIHANYKHSDGCVYEISITLREEKEANK